jgi:hypothetical protein
VRRKGTSKWPGARKHAPNANESGRPPVAPLPHIPPARQDLKAFRPARRPAKWFGEQLGGRSRARGRSPSAGRLRAHRAMRPPRATQDLAKPGTQGCATGGGAPQGKGLAEGTVEKDPHRARAEAALETQVRKPTLSPQDLCSRTPAGLETSQKKEACGHEKDPLGAQSGPERRGLEADQTGRRLAKLGWPAMAG